MIASEETLRSKEVLDQIGSTTRLTPYYETNSDVLEYVITSVIEALPSDIAETFEIEGYQTGPLTTVSKIMKTTINLSMARGSDDESYVVASIDTTLGAVTERNENSSLLLAAELNKSNRDASHGVCVADGNGLIRLRTGSARNVRSSITNWSKMIAYLIVANIASAEDSSSPASSYLALREMETSGKDVYNIEKVIRAAEKFKTSLTPELQAVTYIEHHDNDIAITVPFRVNEMTKALTVFVRRLVEDNGKVEGLLLVGQLYENLPWRQALSWVETLNSVDVESLANGNWIETTPWLLGRWWAQEDEAGAHPVMFTGYVPSVMEEYINLEEVLRGTVREVWAGLDKYRLRQEFNAAIGDIDGTF
jgi:hypothetical protein